MDPERYHLYYYFISIRFVSYLFLTRLISGGIFALHVHIVFLVCNCRLNLLV